MESNDLQNVLIFLGIIVGIFGSLVGKLYMNLKNSNSKQWDAIHRIQEELSKDINRVEKDILRELKAISNDLAVCKAALDDK